MAELNRTLSFPVLLIIGINSIMGTGVFFLHAIAAKEAGPMSIISWAIMGVVAMLIGMIFAELASMFPTAGGVYDYAKKVFSPFVAFIMGWMTMVVGYITIAMLIVGAIRYLNPSLPTIYSISASIVFILLFNFMAYRGMDTSSVMLVTFGIITLSTVLALVVPGLWRFNLENFTPFFTHNLSNVFIGVFLVAETFFGWETVTFLAEETKNPRKVIPKVLLISTAFIGILVLLFALSALSTIPWEVFGLEAAPLSALAGALYGASASPIFSILVYTSIIGSVAGWIVSAPRLLMALAKDKMFVPQLARIHETHNTPHIAIAFQTVLTIFLVIIGAGSYEVLLHLLVPLVFIMYATVALTLIVMRHKFADVERMYTVPFGVAISWFVFVFLIGLTTYWAFTDPTAVATLALAGSFILFGVPIYILLKFTYDPEAIAWFGSFSRHVSVWLENFLLPKSVRRHILSLLNVAGKRVLEFGANVGTFSLVLAQEVGENGLVISTEVSKANADVLLSRLQKNGFSHVQVIHDEHHLSRVHPDIEEVDVVVSVGYLSLLQDLRKILSELRSIMGKNASLVFVEYVDYFGVIPNTGWAADLERLREIFAQEGFSVTVTKKKGFLWNYLIIHGINSESDVPFI